MATQLDREEAALPPLLLNFGPDFSSGMSPEQYREAIDAALALRRASGNPLDSLKICFQEGLDDDHLGSWLEFPAAMQTTRLDLTCNELVVGWDLIPFSVLIPQLLMCLFCLPTPLQRMLRLPLLRDLSLTRIVAVDADIGIAWLAMELLPRDPLKVRLLKKRKVHLRQLKSLEIYVQERPYMVCSFLYWCWMPVLKNLFVEFQDEGRQSMIQGRSLEHNHWFDKAEKPTGSSYKLGLREIRVVGFESREQELIAMRKICWGEAACLEILWLVVTNRTSPFHLEDDHAPLLEHLRSLPKSSSRADVRICHVDQDLVAMPASSSAELLRR